MGEFNVNKSDGSLEQTAGMPSEYPATQVMMSDGVTSVEDVVDELKKSAGGTSVNISSYTSISNYYECPSDGYIRLVGTSNTSAWAYLIRQSTSLSYGIAEARNLSVLTFVRKGARIFVNSATEAIFIPLENYT